MNLLTDTTPDFLQIGETKLKIKTDFALWVKFIILTENNDLSDITNLLNEIFEELPINIDPKKLVKHISEWLWQCENKAFNDNEQKTTSRQAFDFSADGNIIFCELWEYFPHLMKQGISFPQGMELIKLLLSNEKTVLFHRAHARCGDFSKLSKDMKEYWLKERAKYAIKAKQEDIDNVFSGAFM